MSFMIIVILLILIFLIILLSLVNCASTSGNMKEIEDEEQISWLKNRRSRDEL